MYAAGRKGSPGTAAVMKTGSLQQQAGFAYYGLLFSVTAAALVASTGAHLLGNEQRREKETDMLACGDEIRRAIESYHAKNTAGLYPFPTRLEWLVRDPHQLVMQRYLRRVCLEPMQERGADGFARVGGWALILDANSQIVGVRSESLREPLKRAGFMPPYEDFRQAKTYADWRFIAAGGVPAKAGERGSSSSGNFIPSGGLLAPFAAAPPPPTPTPTPTPTPLPATAPVPPRAPVQAPVQRAPVAEPVSPAAEPAAADGAEAVAR